MDKIIKNDESSETVTDQRKRERSVNFSREETDLLVSLAGAKKYIIENKKSGATTWKDKEKAWKEIEKAFNCVFGTVFRNHKHLKLKYESLKRDVRKKSTMIRGNVYKTSKAPVLTAAEQKVKEMIYASVEGNESCFDSDFIVPCTISSEQTAWSPIEEHNFTANASEQTFSDDSSMDIQDSEPPRKKIRNGSKEEESVQCKPEEKRPLDKLIEEKIEIAKIQKEILREELEQKFIQRKILEKDSKHKDFIHELEKQHLQLKIDVLKKVL